MWTPRIAIFSGLLAAVTNSSTFAAETDSLDLSLQELMSVEVTSVAKQKRPLSNSPAAIYVVTGESIRNSGATSIPQALRDVPGLHVAQIDSQKWAISSRGFNGRYNNKLLVMMDGRALYSPQFSGVYWEAQDILMADIDRIEIIRGPSAALWGANAVNGVINIITLNSADTLDGYAELGAGDYETGFVGLRYGATLSDKATARAYLKGNKRDSLEFDSRDIDSKCAQASADLDKDNSWHNLQAGGRADIQIQTDANLTLSGDVYQANMQQATSIASLSRPFFREFDSEESTSDGFNLLSRYTQALSPASEYSVQTYYDFIERQENLYHLRSETFDLEFQHQLLAAAHHNLIWGLGYRYIKDDVGFGPILKTRDSRKTYTDLWSAFLSDEITLVDETLWLTLASRFEYNDYTGFEVQPNARLMWQLNSKNSLWAAVARAVRTPSRVENNIGINVLTEASPQSAGIPVKLWVVGNDDYGSEEIISYEAGYRFVPASGWSLDTTAFYNHYDKLRSSTPARPDLSDLPNYITQDFLFTNNLDGFNFSFELSSAWQASKSVEITVNYSFIQSRFGESPTQNTDAPEHMLSTLVDWRVTNHLDVNLAWRFIGEVDALGQDGRTFQTLDRYHGLDLGLHWQLTPAMTVSAFGKNLLYSDHLEYEGEILHFPYRVGPSYYAKVAVTF